MQLNYGDASLLLITRDRNAQGPCVVVTVGLLCNADQTLVAADDAQGWLTERFAAQPFDRGLKKKRGTFAVHGSAFPLSAAHQAGMAVRVNIGALGKILHVQPPRQWRKGLLGWSPVANGALVPVPVDLAHAYGGTDSPDNPEGIGYTPMTDPEEGLALPQIESPTAPLRNPGEPAPVASFLPLLPQSRDRRVFMGTCDQAWTRQRAPFLPLDMDARWYDEVAQDQTQASYWTGSESWSVAGMHPRHDEVSGRLPGFRPRLFIERASTKPAATPTTVAVKGLVEEAYLELDTLWLFPDVERVLLLYRAQIQVQDIDGDDLAALAVGCERSADFEKKREQWIAELWPQLSLPEADFDAPPGMSPFEAEQVEQLAQLSVNLESDLAVFMAEHNKSLALAGAPLAFAEPAVSLEAVEAMQSSLAALVPKLQVSLDRAHELFSPGAGAKSVPLNRLIGDLQTPADAAALREEIDAAAGPEDIDAMVAECEAAMQQHVEEMARLLDREPHVLLAQARAADAPTDPVAAQAQIDALLSEMDVDTRVAEMEAVLDLYVEETAQAMGMSVQALMAEAKALDPLEKFKVLQSGSHLITGSEASVDSQSASALVKELEGLIDSTKAQLLEPLTSGTPAWTVELLLARHDAEEVFEGEHFEALDFSGAKLDRISLQNCLLQNCVFTGTRLSGADLSRSHFVDCDFSESELSNTCLDAAQFQRCSFDRVKAGNTSFNATYAQQCSAANADFTGVHALASHWVECSFAGATLPASKWTGARWRRCDLEGVNLSKAMLSKTQFQACLLNAIDLRGSDLNDASWSEVTGGGIDLSNASLQQWRLDQCCRLPAVRLDGADLSGASLQQAMLTDASLRNACLAGALISRCDLSGSDGYHADAQGADFTASDLSDARWLGANFMEARLRKVNLTGADLSGSNLHGVLTEGVKGDGTRLDGALLTRCRLLEDLSHG
jgi:uncharacterized protein YjbI with pentapeptide repeats